LNGKPDLRANNIERNNKECAPFEWVLNHYFMEYLNLALGIVLLAVFGWLFYKNRKRTGLLHAFLRLDIIAGIMAGTYLTFASVHSIFF
jgi:hypothetical protein